MSLNKIELHDLLERAAINATGSTQNVDGFVKILENEWVTDIDSLRRMDGSALDELLPTLLSQELQRLIHPDGYNKSKWQTRRGGPPSSKITNSREANKNKSSWKDTLHYSAPPNVVHISEDESLSASSSSESKDDNNNNKNNAGRQVFKVELGKSALSCIIPSTRKRKQQVVHIMNLRPGCGDKLGLAIVDRKEKEVGMPELVGVAAHSPIFSQIPEEVRGGGWCVTTLKSPSTGTVHPKTASEAVALISKVRALKDSKLEMTFVYVGKRNTEGKNNGGSLLEMFNLFDTMCSPAGISTKEVDLELDDIVSSLNDYNESKTTTEGIDDDELQRMSRAHPITINGAGRANHLIVDTTRKADFIANIRKRYSTREALEDAIRCYQMLIEEEKTELGDILARGNTPGSVSEKKRRLIANVEDELRSLYPLRLILHAVGDLTEMMIGLQWQKEQQMREVDMEKANATQKEIDDISDQIDKEERYLLKKKWKEVECIACGDKFTPTLTSKTRKELLLGSLGPVHFDDDTPRRCNECRKVFGSDVKEEQHIVTGPLGELVHVNLRE